MRTSFAWSQPASLRALLALAIVAFLPDPADAGNGRFQNGEYDYCVSVRFNATAAQLSQIRSQFQAGSQVLADATDDQQRFGTIAIVNDSEASNSAEYWINPGTGGAYATAGRYGVRGQHVNLFFDTYFGSRSASHPSCPAAGAIGTAATAYSIAHEHAHHSWAVLDEYSGPGGSAECAGVADTATLDYSLMENYYCRGARATGGGYTLNEFCVASNHDPDADTFQESNNGVSSWETIASHPTRAAIAPAALPAAAPPAVHTVNFLDGFGGLRVMLLLDRSGSMSFENRLEFAKSGGSTFVTFLRDDDELGVASFSSSSSVNFPLTTITGSDTKIAARAAINGLNASGSTNIGGGLLTALGQLTSQSTRSCNEIIVLLSDGDHNTGTPPSAAIPTLRNEGVTVLAVGVGSGISASGQATLQSVASQTGGRFFRVANSFDLVGLFLRLAMESIGNGLLTRDPLVIFPNDVAEVPVPVEAGSQSAVFSVAFANALDDLTIELRTPSGETITEADAATNPGVEFEAGPNSASFRILSPDVGLWTVVLRSGAIVDGTVEVLAFAEHTGVDLLLAVEDDEVVFPQPVVIEATPTFDGQNVVAASVSGTVTRPDGSIVPILLEDDGLGSDLAGC